MVQRENLITFEQSTIFQFCKLRIVQKEWEFFWTLIVQLFGDLFVYFP